MYNNLSKYQQEAIFNEAILTPQEAEYQKNTYKAKMSKLNWISGERQTLDFLGSRDNVFRETSIYERNGWQFELEPISLFRYNNSVED